MALRIIVTALACYFLGNHNGAICVSAMLHDDVREHGSGNAGATNTLRVMGKGAAVIVGRRTVEDFPGQKPLPGRENILLTRSGGSFPGFTVCATVEEALEAVKDAPRVFVIGGGSIYRQLMPYCDTAYITKVHCTIDCDTYFPNLDEDPDWVLTEVLQSGEENGIFYEMCLYKRV